MRFIKNFIVGVALRVAVAFRGAWQEFRVGVWGGILAFMERRLHQPIYLRDRLCEKGEFYGMVETVVGREWDAKLSRCEYEDGAAVFGRIEGADKKSRSRIDEMLRASRA